MEGGSNTVDAEGVAQELKGLLFDGSDAAWQRARAILKRELRGENRADVIQAAMVWGSMAWAITRGINGLEPGPQEGGLYPGEGSWCDPAKIPTIEVVDGLKP